jgi:ABC-type nitrate/sulfonate/bicarbonate transport system permease component
MSSKTVADEVIKPVTEKRDLSFRGIITNEYVLYVISSFVFLAIWHSVAKAQILGKSLATPYDVVREMGRMMTVELAGKNLLGHIWASTQRILIGFSLGAVFGIPLGLFMALNRYVNAVVKPVFDLFKPMPPIAWISISILWFGIGEASKVFIIFIGSFVPCLLNAYNGIRIIDEELYDVVRVLGGNRRDEILQVSFPAALPALFAGIQISISIAWTCVLAAELVGSRSGLGWVIVRGMRLTKPELVIGGMLIIALVAGLFSLSVSGLERLLCPWKRKIAGL